MSKFAILLSCMYEKDKGIIQRSNIKSDCVIINQCNEESIEKINLINNRKCLWINSKERGLSKSRNLAIKHCASDICLIADNDEIFADGIENKIIGAYAELPDADVIIFNLNNKQTKLKNKIYKLKRLEMLRVCSLQISFKRKSVVERKIKFDEKLGAGTGNGAGEENKFLLDAYDKCLKIYHYPVNIATMVENESTWFTGYDEEYFYKRGMSTRYILGFTRASLYGLYFIITKYNLYKNEIRIIDALKNLKKGILENKLVNNKNG
jgi:glycosyltransferase involved in cell wall biosynthesis